jgi:NAD(P)-dependent dehydrogenase (short-subunit alcohol dehydrogenase family)
LTPSDTLISTYLARRHLNCALRRLAVNRRALVVTGGSRGICAEIARRAAQQGTPVAIIHQSRSDAAGRVVAGIREAGGAAIAVAADVGVPEEVKRAFAAVDHAFGGIGGLVNGAVYAGPPARITEWSPEEVERVYRTNVFGALNCLRETVPRLSTQKGGRGGGVVTLTSVVALQTGGAGTWVPFAGSKAALETMSRGLAKELAPEGIRVNTVRCGVIGTETRLTQPKEYLERTLAQVPLARMGQLDEVAASVLWLLSSEASYVTGATLDAAGGL